MPPDGTVEKAIFFISCTTCHARLAVRSEAAVGQILECPKCGSFVQVLPPPGWQSVPAAPLAAATSELSGPPPLDRIADAPLALELEPVSWHDALLRRVWFLWGAALIIVGFIVWGLFALLMPAPARESATKPPVGTTMVSERAAPAMAREDGDGAARDALPAPKFEGMEKESALVPPSGSDESAPSPVPSPPLSLPGPPTGDAASSPGPSSGVEKPPALPSPPGSPSGSVEPPPDARETPQERAAAPANGKPVEIKKTPPPPVDVAARLADTLAALELTDVTLAGALDFLSSLGAIPISFDADALARLGVSPRDRVAVRLGPTTVGDALKAVAAERGLAVVVENNQVVITAAAKTDASLKTVRYTISDLTGGDRQAASALASMVMRLFAPDSWQGAGGRATVDAEPGALVVVQTADVQRQVLEMCEKLRVARKIPTRSGGDPERFSIATRRERAAAMLQRPISANFHEPTPLKRILAYLAEASGGDILIDRAALADDDASDRVETSISVRERPLESVLDELLPPLGMAYRIVGPALLEVTSREAVEERRELEFYPIGSLLDEQNTAEKWLSRLKAEAAPTSWSEAGGQGEVFFDAPSQTLIVLQSPPVQALVARMLKR